MKNSEVSTHSKCTELWLPSFKLDVNQSDAALRKWHGLTLKGISDDKTLHVSEVKQVVHIETSKGMPQKESLQQNTANSPNKVIIEKPFLFGKQILLISL